MLDFLLRRVRSYWMLLLCVPPALAQQTASAPAYTIEVIVFRTSAVGSPEDWSAQPLARGFGNDGKPGAAPQVIRTLTPADYKLGGMESTLRTSGAWRPLAHAAWVQTAGAWGDPQAGLNLSDVGIDVPGLTGTIYVERGQYVHLGFNLSYANGGPTYVISEMRSIKLGDKLYFDHPAFGVLATVSAARR